MFEFRWSLDITLTTPFNTSGIESVDSFIDTALLRDHRGRLIISGHQIAGYFRHFLLQVMKKEQEAKIQNDKTIISKEIFKSWFGEAGNQLWELDKPKSENMPQVGMMNERGRLIFRDIIIDIPDEVPTHSTSTRIKIDKQTGSVVYGAMQIMERFSLPGVEVKSKTDQPHILLIGNEPDKLLFEKAFNLFCQSMIALGANKAQGFGRVKIALAQDYKENKIMMQSSENQSTAKSDCKSFVISFDAPLLVEPELLSGNLFKSNEVISGALIKAAIAELGAQINENFQTEFGEALSKLRISHARLAQYDTNSKTTTATQVLPFDIVIKEDANTRHFVNYFKNNNQNLIFQNNFKSKQRAAAKEKLGVSSPPYMSRTRTSIQQESYVPEENMLFTYQSIAPEYWNDNVWERTCFQFCFCWEATYDKQVEYFIQLLNSGLVKIGKLRSAVNVMPYNGQSEILAIKFGKTWRLQLITPAHLLTYKHLEKISKDRRCLKEVYKEIFKDQIKKSLDSGNNVDEMIDWDSFDLLVSHEYIGGHKAMRFKQTIEDESRYFPYCMTKEGSVFVFKERNESDVLMKAMNHLLMWGLHSAGEDLPWSEYPFSRNNGYGEVAIQPLDDAFSDGVRVI